MRTKIKKEWIGVQLTHKIAGNGLCIVAQEEPEWSRVTYANEESLGRAWLAATDHLSPFTLRDPETNQQKELKLLPNFLEKLNAVRTDIATGKTRIVETHIRPA